MNNETNKINLHEKIFQAIEAKKIKMRPRWEFRAEKLGLESALILVFLLISAMFSLIFLYSQVNEIHRLLEFGPEGCWYFFKSFPFEIFIFIGTLFLVLNLLAKRLEINYKVRPMVWYGILMLVFFIMVITSELIGFHKSLAEFENTELPFLKPYFGARMHNISNHSFEGDVVDINDEKVVIMRMQSNGPTTTIIMHKNINLSSSLNHMRKGDHIRVLGKPRQEKFEAWGAYSKPATGRVQ